MCEGCAPRDSVRVKDASVPRNVSDRLLKGAVAIRPKHTCLPISEWSTESRHGFVKYSYIRVPMVPENLI